MLLRQDLLELPQHTTGYRSVEDQRVGWRRPQDGLEQQILGPATPVPNSPEAGRGCHLQPVPATVSLSLSRFRLKHGCMDRLEMRGDHLAANRYRARAQLIRGTAAETAGASVRHQLLQIAEEYEWLAEAVENGALGIILRSR